jgi:hypothetical protein
MRFLIKLTLENDAANKTLRGGTLAKTITRALDELKPEAVYFTTVDGQRTGFVVADLKDAHQMPFVAEPWFLAFNARVEFYPAMTLEDLQRAGPDLERAAKTYG